MQPRVLEFSLVAVTVTMVWPPHDSVMCPASGCHGPGRQSEQSIPAGTTRL